MGRWNNHCQSAKTLWIIYQNACLFYVKITPRHQCQLSIIRFVPKYLHQTLVGFSVSTAGDGQTVTVRCCSVTISCGFKVEFCVENKFHGILAWSDYSADKCIRIATEKDMTPFQVSCWRSKFLPQTQSVTPSTIHQYMMEQSAWRTCDLRPLRMRSVLLSIIVLTRFWNEVIPVR